MMNADEDIELYARYSPFIAALNGRDDNEKKDIYKRFSKLPDELQNTLTSTETADKIESWERQGMFPASYSNAVAKLVALIILGIVRPEQLGILLQKIGLDQNSIQQTSNAIETLTTPAVAFLKGYHQTLTRQTTTMSQLPPMTRPMENGPQPLTPSVPKSKVPERNIIDLRKDKSA